MPTDAPDDPTSARIEAFADAVYELLRVRASSLGALDVDVEVDGWFVDGEVLFASGPDMGFSVDTAAGTCVYCRLTDDGGETWLDDARIVIEFLAAAGSDQEERVTAHAHAVLSGLLDARRPLLRTEPSPDRDTPPREP